jgi:hypothetical protein
MKSNIAFVFLAFAAVGSEDAVSQTLRLSLRLQGNSFIESQAIWAHVVILNQGPVRQEVQPLVLTDDISRGVRFVLTDEQNNALRKSTQGFVDDFGMAKPISIAPGDSLAQWYNLVTWFSNSGFAAAPPYLPTRHYLKAGSYWLQAVQFTGRDTLMSDKVMLVVSKPVGNELLALKALREADRNYSENGRDNRTIFSYQQILNRFPQSIYAPYAYYRLIFINHYLHHDHNKAFELILKLSENFPNDPQSLTLISGYAPILLDEGRKDVLERIAQTFPNTKVGRLSKQILQDKQ